MTDDELRRAVAAELSLDPRTGGEAIEVSAANGTVTLLGTLVSFRLKQAAGSAAARVRGVTRVVNELRVRIPPGDRRTDEDLRGDVLEALMLDVSVPMTVDARARDGFVTLTGTADWHYQRQAAESRTTQVPGVADVENAITLTQTPDAREAGGVISAAFRRNAVLDAAVLSVETSSDGLVILWGTVSSWAAHDQAVASAWSVPGIIQVEDRIRVESGA